MRRRRIAVAGCGVAGLSAALLLHRDGHDVTLYERFATPQPVGSGLMIQPTGLAVLDRLGLADAIVARGARIDRLFGEAGASGRTVLDVRYAALSRERYGIGIHRGALFATLYDAVAAAQLKVRAGRAIVAAEAGILRFEDGGESTPYDLVVDALGARSILSGAPAEPLVYGALWATVPWCDAFDAHALQQRYRAASVMAGVLPVGEYRAALFWSLRADRHAAWAAAGLDAWKAEVTALWPATAPLLAALIDPAQLTFARYAHRTLAAPAGERIIHIGDAWHATSPQLGQGANMALLDAWALAMSLRREDEVQAAIASAVRLRRGHVRLYQAMSALFTPVYQSDSRLLPWLRDWMVGPMSKLWPATRIQAAMVSGLAGSPLRRLELA
jgi:2-polyprenyl-6-methoxyphenol hydroxylase-like FAD-dependent oxidoreductase